MKKIILPIFTTILLVLLIAASYYNISFNTKDRIDGIESKQKYEKLISGLEDDKKINDLISSYKESISNQLNGGELEKLITNGEISWENYKNIVETYPEHFTSDLKKEIDKIINVKRDSLYKAKKELLSIKIENTQKPNFWLISFIVLSAGILGGYARTNYSLLLSISDYLKKMKKQLDDATTTTTTTGGQTTVLSQPNATLLHQISSKTEEIELKVQEAINDGETERNSIRTSILFGVIASSVSILALNLTKSKILEFQDGIDYFLLWGWCVLGAVYAKSWIANIYDRITQEG